MYACRSGPAHQGRCPVPSQRPSLVLLTSSWAGKMPSSRLTQLGLYAGPMLIKHASLAAASVSLHVPACSHSGPQLWSSSPPKAHHAPPPSTTATSNPPPKAFFMTASVGRFGGHSTAYERS